MSSQPLFREPESEGRLQMPHRGESDAFTGAFYASGFSGEARYTSFSPHSNQAGPILFVASFTSSAAVESQLSARFGQLVETWRREVGPISFTAQMVIHPAYQQIIAMGLAAVPFLLRELEDQPDHWFWALEVITGENAVLPAHVGSVRSMAQDWLDWGKRHGYR